MYHNKIRQYHKTEAVTATKLAQVAILLEHCASLLRKATIAIETKNYEERYLCTDKVMVIINSIQSSLAVDKSAEAVDLNDFFQRIIVLLLEVGLKQNAVLCSQIEVALSEMASVWRLADSNNSQPPIQQQDQPTTQAVDGITLSA